MTLKDTIDNMIVRVWHNGMRCMSTANIEDYKVSGVQAFIDRETQKCVLDIEVRDDKTVQQDNI